MIHNLLTHQIENKTYEKTMLGQTNFEETLPEEVRRQAILAVKEEYTFDFLDLSDEHNECQLETAIPGRIEPFLLDPPRDGSSVSWRSVVGPWSFLRGHSTLSSKFSRMLS